MIVDVNTLYSIVGWIADAATQDWSQLTPTEIAILNHQIGQLKAAAGPIRVKQEDADRRLKGISL